MEIQLISGMADGFKEATEGNKICMAGIDRIDYLGKGLATLHATIQKCHSRWRYHSKRGHPQTKDPHSLKAMALYQVQLKNTIRICPSPNTAGMLGAYYHFKTNNLVYYRIRKHWITTWVKTVCLILFYWKFEPKEVIVETSRNNCLVWECYKEMMNYKARAIYHHLIDI